MGQTEPNEEPENGPNYEYSDFMPGDVVRWENGLNVVVDGIVQVGRPPAYGYAFSSGTDKLVVLQLGCTDGQHIAPDRHQPEDGPADRFAVTRGAVDENIAVVPPEAVIEKDPNDHSYKDEAGSQRTDDDIVFNPQHITQSRYLDERFYTGQ